VQANRIKNLFQLYRQAVKDQVDIMKPFLKTDVVEFIKQLMQKDDNTQQSEIVATLSRILGEPDKKITKEESAVLMKYGISGGRKNLLPDNMFKGDLLDRGTLTKKEKEKALRDEEELKRERKKLAKAVNEEKQNFTVKKNMFKQYVPAGSARQLTKNSNNNNNNNDNHLDTTSTLNQSGTHVTRKSRKEVFQF
jgi:hypothetical protein